MTNAQWIGSFSYMGCVARPVDAQRKASFLYQIMEGAISAWEVMMDGRHTECGGSSDGGGSC